MAAPRAITLLLLLTLALPAFHAAPSNGDWTPYIVSGLSGEDFDDLSLAAGNSGQVGVAFHRVTSNDVGFAIGNNITGFTVQAADIQPADTAISSPRLHKVSDTDWVIAAKTSSTSTVVYKSTDSGQTWTRIATFTSAAMGAPVLRGQGNTLALMVLNSDGSNVAVWRSTNGGTTWGATWFTETGVITGDLRVDSALDIKYYQASGTSTSPNSVRTSYTQDGGGYWSALTQLTGFTSYNTFVRVANVPGPLGLIVKMCATSCSATPQYSIRYWYGSAQDLQNVGNTGGGDISRNANGATLVITQNGGIPTLNWADDATTALTVLSTPFPDADNTAVGKIQSDRIYVALSNGAFNGRLEVWSAPIPTTPPVAVPNDSVSVPSLSGFAMDERGFTGIVRYTVSGENYVRTLNGAQLTLSQASDNTHCSRTEGVMAFYSAQEDGRTYVAYLQCATGDESDVAAVRIRAADLGDPFVPDYCHTKLIDYCHSSLDDGELASPDDDLRHIRSLHRFPIDYSGNQDPDVYEVHMAWAFTTTNGKAGLVSYTFRGSDLWDLDDKSQVTTEDIDVSGGPVDYSCTTTNLRNGEDYFFAGAQASDVKGYRIQYTPENDDGLNDGASSLQVRLVGLGVGGSGTRSPRAIGCGNNILVVARNDGEVLAINVTTGARHTILHDPVHLVTSNGLTVDPAGQTAAWIRNGQIQLYDLGNWSFVANLTAPTGALNSLVLTYYSKDLFVALNDRVERYGVGVLFGTDGFTANPSADTDNDGVINSDDPDLDGDGICNTGGPQPKGTLGAEAGCQPGPGGVDPDVDGDGLCNDDEDLPEGTHGAIYGCTGGDTDDDDDAVPDSHDEAPTGSGPNVGGCINCHGDGTHSTEHPFGLSDQAAFGWGLVLIAILAVIGYALAGPAPMVVGGLATLGILAAVAFRFWSPWTIVALGGATGVITFSSVLAKRVGGKT